MPAALLAFPAQKSQSRSGISRPVNIGRSCSVFSHVMIGTNDLEKAKSFYDALLGTLGVPPGRIAICTDLLGFWHLAAWSRIGRASTR